MRTLAEIDRDIREARAALKASTVGSSYSIGSRSYTRHELEALREQITVLVRERKAVAAALAGATNPSVSVAVWR